MRLSIPHSGLSRVSSPINATSELLRGDRNMTMRDVSRIILVSTDALGPPTRSVLVRLKDGEVISYDGDDEIMGFALRLGQVAPEVANRIVRELAVDEGMTNCEKVIF
jgi:hypothetical protein